MNKKRGLYMISDSLKLRFNGPNEIDLNTLAVSLNSTINVLQTLAKNMLRDDDFCKFRVESIESGSFVITIQQIIDFAPALFAYAPSILEGFNNIIELRKTLKGCEPKSIKKDGQTISITAYDNSVINIDHRIFNTYTNNPSIETDMANMSNAVLNDDERTGIIYDFYDNDGNKSSIQLEKHELVNMARKLDVEKFDEDIEENTMQTNVKIRRPDFNCKSKWQVVLNGKTISADIIDEEFISKVKNGSVDINSKTIMNVTLRVRYKGEKTISYTVLKVNKIIKDCK